MAILRYSEDLEDIVAAANVAGYLEKDERIFVETDTELTEFLIQTHNKWAAIGGEDNNDENFLEYAAAELLERFGTEEA